MAKKFAKVLGIAADAMYSEKNATITARAQVAWDRAFAGEDSNMRVVGTVDGKGFEVQIPLRIASHAADKTATAGDRIVKRLNAAKSLDWETVTGVVTEKKDFLIEVGDGRKGIDFINNAGKYEAQITATMGAKVEEEEELAIQNIIDAVDVKNAAADKVEVVSLGTIDTTKQYGIEELGEKLSDLITIKAIDLKQKVDKFNSGARAVAVHGSTIGNLAMKKHFGSAFTITDPSKFEGQVVPRVELSNEVVVYENSYLDRFTIDRTTATPAGKAAERIAAILIVDDAYLFTGLDKNTKPLNTSILDERFVGYSYTSANLIVKPKRILVVTYDGTITKKVDQVTV